MTENNMPTIISIIMEYYKEFGKIPNSLYTADLDEVIKKTINVSFQSGHEKYTSEESLLEALIKHIPYPIIKPLIEENWVLKKSGNSKITDILLFHCKYEILNDLLDKVNQSSKEDKKYLIQQLEFGFISHFPHIIKRLSDLNLTNDYQLNSYLNYYNKIKDIHIANSNTIKNIFEPKITFIQATEHDNLYLFKYMYKELKGKNKIPHHPYLKLDNKKTRNSDNNETKKFIIEDILTYGSKEIFDFLIHEKKYLPPITLEDRNKTLQTCLVIAIMESVSGLHHINETTDFHTQKTILKRKENQFYILNKLIELQGNQIEPLKVNFQYQMYHYLKKEEIIILNKFIPDLENLLLINKNFEKYPYQEELYSKDYNFSFLENEYLLNKKQWEMMDILIYNLHQKIEKINDKMIVYPFKKYQIDKHMEKNIVEKLNTDKILDNNQEVINIFEMYFNKFKLPMTLSKKSIFNEFILESFIPKSPSKNMRI